LLVAVVTNGDGVERLATCDERLMLEHQFE
jgi:hypothetical protein